MNNAGQESVWQNSGLHFSTVKNKLLTGTTMRVFVFIPSINR